MRPAVRSAARVLQPAARLHRRRLGTRGLTILGWHRVDGVSQGLSTGVDDFRRHLDELAAWGAAVLPLEAALAALDRGTLPDRAVALTFDDGYASVVETAWPILRDRGLPATFYVVSDYLDGDARFPWDREEPPHDRHRLVRADELVDVAADGMDIGSHTATHPWLPRLDDAGLVRELADSRVVLEDLLGRPVPSLAYPTGGWTPRVRAAAAAAGYGNAVTVDRGINTARTARLSLRRAFVPPDPRDLRLILDGAYTVLRPVDTWRRRGGPPW